MLYAGKIVSVSDVLGADFFPGNNGDEISTAFAHYAALKGVSTATVTAVALLDLGTPARDSTTYFIANGTGSHSVTVKAGGTLSDIWWTQRNAANGFANDKDFYAAVLACNPAITDINQVQVGQIIYLPEKFSDGSITYNYANGTSINSNAANGAYYMVLPNESGGQSIYSRTVDVDAGYTVRQVDTDAQGNVTQEFVGFQSSLDSAIEQISLAHINNDAAFDAWGGLDPWDTQQGIFGTDGAGNPTVNAPSEPLTDIGQLFDAEERMLREFNEGWITQEQYYAFQNFTLNYSLTSGSNGNYIPVDDLFDFSFDPIGAFYDSQSSTYDNAPSIASHTPVVLDAANRPVTAAQLAVFDTNGDAKLATAETAALKFWRDLDEDGHTDAGEIGAIDRSISQADLTFYTRTSGHAGIGLPTQAGQQLATPSKVDLIQSVPDSNYRTLRDTDNLYFFPDGRFISWSASNIKINVHNKSYLIGTDGADNFDDRYFSAYPWSVYFNSSLLTNFLAGGGNDVMGGSSRNDNLWGGTGNDVLFGYAGDDKVYGEQGGDELQGNEGNDYLDGGLDNDRLFGQVGDDVLHGGDGNDILVGFTASNEAKQTLNVGETDNDYLYGGSGDDTLYGGLGNDYLDGGANGDLIFSGVGNDVAFGGDGNDELQGEAGNDRLLGEGGDDRLFGQAGNDTLWGGDGNDVIVGFTGSNVTQSLAAGETDDDVLIGGAGRDLLLGDVGEDTLYGGTGLDELQGGAGNDSLYGEGDKDNLFGQLGNDTLYGGDGDDLLVGFTGSNEAKQTLNAGETDNDALYGGVGTDTLLGGLGNDYLDGGAGADVMVGGVGDDIYIVNSVNDSIYERAGEGYDTVITNANYLLNANVEELRLLEGFSIHGTGNAMDNKIIGNSSDNILDGVTGVDTMIGGAGNDTYYVDNADDIVTEVAGEGADTVQSGISYTLAENLENLVLLDFSKPEKGLVDGQQVLVYGYPKRNELDYMQGDAVENYRGTCALTSIANLLTQTGRPTTESQVVTLAINNNWTLNNPELPSYRLGGTTVADQRNILNSYQIRNDVIYGYNEAGLANLVRGGRGVIVGLNAGYLWGEDAYINGGVINHAITLTGVVYKADDGGLAGFYIADSGRGKVSDMTRFLSIDVFRRAANVLSAYAIYTVDPIKLWEEDINGIGNSAGNTLVGNRGHNLLQGLAGDDVLEGDAGNDDLEGGAGNDSLSGGVGDDVYRFGLGDGHDVALGSEGADTLVFKAGIDSSSVTVTRDANELVLSVNAQDSVRFSNTEGIVVDRITFSDGTTWYAKADGTGFNARLSGSLNIVGEARQGQTLSLYNTLDDADGVGAFNYQWQCSSNGADWDDIAGATSGSLVLGRDQVGLQVRVRLSYIDGRGSAEQVVTLASDPVINANAAPVLETPLADQSATEDTFFSFTVPFGAFNDLDVGDSLTYTATMADGSTLPGWLTFDATTRTFSGVPENGDVGSLNIEVTATDTAGASVSSIFEAVVANTNDAPTAAGIADQLATENAAFSFTIPADAFSDVDAGDTLTLLATLSDGSALPSWLSFDADTRTFSGTPSVGQLADYVVRVTARDSAGAEAGTDFTLAVAAAPDTTVAGTVGDDILQGFSGNDTLDGGTGADMLIGGLGNDVLSGGEGGDSYVINRGDGVDVIIDNSGDDNTIVFGAGIDAAQIRLFEGSLGLDLGDGDVVHIENVDYDDIANTSSIRRFVFADGTVLTADELVARGFDLDGTSDGDTIHGTNVTDRIAGGGGDDILEGGLGDDTYFFDSGFGSDVIRENDATSGNVDRIVFGDGIDSSTVSAMRDAQDLLLVASANEQVRIENWFTDDAHKVERIEFADGNVWGVADLRQMTNHAPVAGLPIADQAAIEDAAFNFAVPADAFVDGDGVIGDTLTLSATLADGSVLPSWLSFDAATRTFSGTPENGDVGSLSLKVTATDGVDASASQTFVVAVANTNDAPIVTTAVGGQSATEDAVFSFTVPADVFVDVDVDDALTYSASLSNGDPLPSWLSFDAVTRTFSGTPANGDVGAFSLKVTATDGVGASASQTFAVAVANSNDAPVVATTLGDQSAIEDAPFSFTVAADTFADVDVGDTLTYSASLSNGDPLPSWLSFDAVTRTFSGMPENGDVGSLSLEVTATDAAGAMASSTFSVVVANTNDAPTANGIADHPAIEDAAFSFTVPADAFDDIDVDDTLMLSATLADGSALPSWLNFDAATRTFSGTPENGDVGSLSLKVTATDVAGASASSTFAVIVANTNDTPTAAGIADQTATEDAVFSLTVPADAFADVDAGDTLTLSATLADGTALPGWLSFDAATGTFSGTPENGDVGSLSLKVTATDTVGASATSTFAIAVANTNDAPTANGIADQAATEDAAFSFTVPADTFVDVDAGDTLTLSATLADGSGLPNWLSFDATTRTFSGMPENGDVGSLSLKVMATDAAGSSASSTFAVVVANTNDAPTANGIADQAATEDAAFSFTVPADAFDDIDVDDMLTLSATLADGSALPSWLSFDAATRTFSGTPENGDVGSVSLKVIATDQAGTSAGTEFAVAIANTNDAPMAANAVADQSATEDAMFSFTVPADAFADVDAGDTLTLSATLADGSALPSWLNFDAITRTLSGTPENGDVGSLSLTVTATDAAGALASQTFAVAVANINDVPTVAIAVGDQSAVEDAAFSFAVPADAFADVDVGDALTLSATLADGSALPNWLSFDAATRTFNGTPANGDVGSLSLTVTATDGVGASASQTFAVAVANTNDAPIVATTLGDQSAIEDAAFSFTVAADAFADVDVGDTLTYSASLSNGDPLPSWLSFDAVTRTFSGMPENGDVGSLSLDVTATDAAGAKASSTFAIIVTNTNDAPTANGIADHPAIEDAAFSFTVPADAFADVDVGDTLTLSSTLADGSALPSWLSFDAVTRTFSGTPENGDVGSLSLKVTATDEAGASVMNSFNLAVVNTNDIPILVAPLADVQLARKADFSWQLPAGSFTDVDNGDSLAYSAALADGSALPTWLAFDIATQTFSGHVPANEKGSLDIRVTATDGHGSASAASDIFRITLGKGGGEHGNEGVGNGQDAPPPGHSGNYNDGAGTSPGHPGSKGGSKDDDDRDDRKSKHGADAHDHKTAYLNPKDLDRHYADFTGERREADHNGYVGRWIEVDLAVSRWMAAQDKSLPSLHEGKGADIGALHRTAEGFLGSKTARGHDPLSLAAGTDLQLKSFRGLGEGLQRLG